MAIINNRHSIFVKIILIFVVIVIPIYLMGYYFYKSNHETLQEQLLNNIEQQMDMYVRDLKISIDHTKSLQIDLLLEQKVNYFVNTYDYMNDIEKVEYIKYIQERLDIIKSSSQYVQSASLYVPQLNRMLSSTGSEYQIINTIDENTMNELKGLYYADTFTNKLRDGRLISVYPSHVEEEKLPKAYLLVVEFNLETIENEFSLIRAMEEDEYIFIDHLSQHTMDTSLSDQRLADVFKALEDIKGSSDSYEEKGTINLADGEKYMYVDKVSEYLGVQLIKLIPYEQISIPLMQYQRYFWSYSVLAFLMLITFVYIMFNMVYKPLFKLENAFTEVKNGNIDIRLDHKHKDEFGHIYNRFNDMLVTRKNYINQVYEQKIHIQSAELKQLQAQINPHFLYNSFFILNSLTLLEDYESLEKFTKQLGEYFKFITRNDEDEIPLIMEIKHVRLYTDIQTIRFGERIHIDFAQLPKAYENVRVPRLIIQPIVENAFKYALEKKHSEGILRVTYEVDDISEWLTIAIEDNSEMLDDAILLKLVDQLEGLEEVKVTTGLFNIHNRLKIMYGEQGGLKVSRSELGGLRVSVMISLTDKKL